MRITIDTKEDSHEDIKKVLSILHHLVESKQAVQGAPVSDEQTTSMMSMFDSAPAQTEEIPQANNDSAPDFSSFLNLTNKEEDNNKDSEGRIEFF